MNITDFASAAEAAGWTKAGEDKDYFGDFRSAGWRNAAGDRIVHVETMPGRRQAIARVVVSTVDELGWAASKVDSWAAVDGDLDGALEYLSSLH